MQKPNLQKEQNSTESLGTRMFKALGALPKQLGNHRGATGHAALLAAGLAVAAACGEGFTAASGSGGAGGTGGEVGSGGSSSSEVGGNGGNTSSSTDVGGSPNSSSNGGGAEGGSGGQGGTGGGMCNVTEEKVVAPDAAEGDKFGASVSNDGNTEIYGAPMADALDGSGGGGGGSPISNSGAAYVRDKNGWTKLTADDAETGDEFGHAVDVDGDFAIVGAPMADNNSLQDSGSAYVYVRDINGDWSQEAELASSDLAAGDRFGFSVSIDADRALVGANWNDDAGGASGSAYIFKRNGSGVWNQEKKLTAGDAAADDEFGSAVSLSGDLAIVGAPQNDHTSLINPGAAYVFKKNVVNNWLQEQKMTSGNPMNGGRFGTSVSIDGMAAAIGAPGANSGEVYLWEKSGSTWSQLPGELEQKGLDAVAMDQFGLSVKLDGSNLMVGAPLDDEAAANAGAAFLFQNQMGTWNQVRKIMANDILANDSGADDHMGESVSVSGNVALIGAKDNDDNGSSSGSAYKADACEQ